MERVFREELAAGSKAVWLWAVVGSLAIHFSLMAVALAWKGQLPAKPKRIVPVEAITLTQALPGPTGGGGGLPKPAASTSPQPNPAPPPVIKPTPKPKPRRVVKPKPQVRKTVHKPEKVEAPEPPPSLALPRPASPSTASASGRTTASLGRSTGSARGPGGTGGGPGGGSGNGSGVGQGPGPGAGSLLQSYLRQVRQMLERQKKYPRMAQRMNMQGVVLLRFTIAADGGIRATRLCRTSGHDLLDEAAQETVRRVGRFPPLPSALGRQKLCVEIPLAFRLTN
jgi:protein TonB